MSCCRLVCVLFWKSFAFGFLFICLFCVLFWLLLSLVVLFFLTEILAQKHGWRDYPQGHVIPNYSRLLLAGLGC